MLRTDLALEEVANENNVEKVEYERNGCRVSKIVLTEDNAKKYKKNEGIYYTIETKAFRTEDHNAELLCEKELTHIFKDLLNTYEIGIDDEIFIVGLGNQDITPDALGPMTMSKVIVTRHLHEYDNLSDNMRIVSAISPGVMGQTGIETSDIIKAIIKSKKPKLVIVIDALASRSLRRIAQSVQISTGGISPGSGVGNKRKEISKKTIGVPVIAVGVPTVVDIMSISNDIFDSIGDEITNERRNIYLSKVDESDHLDFMVTPKEIDRYIMDISIAISNALNKSIHNI